MLTALLVGVVAATAPASETTPPTPGPGPAGNAEAARFDDGEFRSGLRSRGLTDLLELYLAEFPPNDPAEAMLLRREVKLAQYGDAARSPTERTEALKAADDFLTQLIRSRPDDPRGLEWRLELVRSLLYRHAEPHALHIIFRGGTDDDRERLFQLMGRGGEQLNSLLDRLEKEYARLDTLPARQYDRLERKGYIEKIERLQPEAEYTRWWVTFYRALSRASGDPLREQELRSVLAGLRGSSDALVTPHETSHVQAQALLLAGMASRRLGDATAAGSYLSSAINTVRGLANPKEREELEWVLTLALLEQVRALRDTRQFERARDAVDDFGAHLTRTAPTNFALQLVRALLERSVDRAEGEQAAGRGDLASARRLRERSTRALVDLAGQSAAFRDEIYAVLYEQMDPAAAPSRLPVFEQCALLAGLLREASQLRLQIGMLDQQGESAPKARRDALETRRLDFLDRAIARAQALLTEPAALSNPLHAEVLFNLAVAHYHRGHRYDAARRFLEVADALPSFGRAEAAANNAVQLAARLRRDPTLRADPAVTTLYLRALQTVTGAFPGTEGARYWQYFLAQTHEELGELDLAAEAYDRVAAPHEHDLEALASAVRCRANRLKELSSAGPADAGETRRRVNALARAADRFATVAQGLEATTNSAERQQLALLLSARVRLNLAEVYVLPGVDQPEQALDALTTFETRFAEQRELMGRALRVRVIAYESLGRLDEAEAAIPRYVESDPASAGTTLQGLFDSIRDEIDRLERAGRMADAGKKAASALLLARQIHEWAQRRSPPLPASDLYAVTLQLAESHLRAGEWEGARRVFEQCLATDAERYEDGRPRDFRAVAGMAEALYGMKRFDAALPLFNRVARESTTQDALWWKALLRDLQCRTELEQDPHGVLKVIAQHRFLQPTMGGLRDRFDELEAVNRKRADQG